MKIKYYRNKADKLWYLKLLKPKCEVCGEKAIHVHHFYYKSTYGHLRYDLDNGISLCMKCHFALHTRDPKRIEELIIEARGKRWYNRLKKKSRTIPKNYKTNITYYKNIIEELK